MVLLMKIGVIAIQGAVSEHVDALKKALVQRGRAAEIVRIKHKGIVPECNGIVIPGGESTTLCRLLAHEGIAEGMKGRGCEGSLSSRYLCRVDSARKRRKRTGGKD